ncbi:MAG TPA: LptF/LptG family permease [Pyrinomonadaceae bacterium]|nr:LptF/LptG family permease [Pyrinomonadaceae bacterium]
MNRFGWLISSYLVRTILPYFSFAWILLSVILFVQQSGRYSDIFFGSNIPKNLIWQLTFALVPNVIAFTCPMAVLIGVVIGLSKMQGDSELIAIRAAGVGSLQITIPILIFGILLSGFTFLTNIYGIPFAAQIVRKIAIQTAIYKLESPIEPGVFNTEINGLTIYVKNGDFEKGTWKNIFIFSENPENKQLRLITSRSGRIDNKGEISELVLENAVVNTFSTENIQVKTINENVGQIRWAIKTKRGEMIQKLSNREVTSEELGLKELGQFVKTKKGKEKTEAEIIFQRRIVLSITPLIFALLGTALVLRFNRGGKGFGIFLALISLISYYLIALLGEQLARTNIISVLIAGLFPIFTSILLILYFNSSARLFSKKFLGSIRNKLTTNRSFNLKKPSKKVFYLNLSTGILDFDIVFNLIKYFLLTFLFLTFIYLIFTVFELWKFVADLNNGPELLVNYLFFLLPYVYVQLAPSALMIAILATFVIKSRQNEVVTWMAAGQSVYRLLLPCFVLMILVGFVNWKLQEKVLPATNQTQDKLREQIRSRGILAKRTGKSWVANDKRIYSFELDESGTENSQRVKNLSVYEFSDDEARLQAVYRTKEAIWSKDKIKFGETAEKTIWNNNKVETTRVLNGELAESSSPFDNLYEKPSHLDSQMLKKQIADGETEQKDYEVALEKKYSTPFLPFVIALFTAPFALSLNRKGKVVTIGYAIGVWLLFMGFTNTFEQFGINGFLSPTFAIWTPLFLFSLLGIYLLSKVRT